MWMKSDFGIVLTVNHDVMLINFKTGFWNLYRIFLCTVTYRFFKTFFIILLSNHSSALLSILYTAQYLY